MFHSLFRSKLARNRRHRSNKFHRRLLLESLEGRLLLTFGFTAGPNVPVVAPFPADGGVSNDVKLADLDNDGDLDAIVGAYQANRILINNGAGGYTQGQVFETDNGNGTINIAVGDVNGDGFKDIVVSNFRGARPASLWINNGNATFTRDTAFIGAAGGGEGLAFGDIDGDTDLDLLQGNRVWKNNGTGTFTNVGALPAAVFYTQDIELADLDGDGDLDAAVAGLGIPGGGAPLSFVLFNNGTGVFSQGAQTFLPNSDSRDVDLSDINGDGKIDMIFAVVGGVGTGIWVYGNNGTGTFTQIGSTIPGGMRRVETADLDGDGDLDMVTTRGSNQPIRLNNGTGIFTQFNNPTALGAGLSVAIGDGDGDGDLDIFQGNGGYASGFGGHDRVLFSGLAVTNSPPTIASNVAAVSANEGGTATNAGTFNDAQGRSTVTITASVGTVTKNDTLGTWSWSINAADGPAGPFTVTITATDNQTAAANTTFTYVINNVPPTISLSGNATVDEGSPYTLNLGVVTDPGVDTITSYKITWGDGSFNSFTGSPANTTATHTYADGPSNQTHTVTVTDEDGTFLAGSLSVLVLNVDPTAADDAVTLQENDSAQVVNVLANDSDPAGTNDPLSVTSVNTAGTIGAVTLNAGQVSYSPDGFFEALGTGETTLDTFEYTISDGDGGTATATVNVTITGQNDAPTAIGTLSDVTVNQNAADSVISLTGLFADVDTNDTLTITAISSSSGLVTAAVSGSAMTLDYQANQSGTATITVTATDGSGASVSLTFEVAVLSPAQQGNALIQLFQQWKADGKINAGVANSMIVKIVNSLKSYDKGNLTAAGNQLTALKNEISAKVKPGSLTLADALLANSLIDALYDSMTP